MTKGLAHVALYTNLFEETIQFYEDSFEAKNLGTFKTSVRGCWLAIGNDILEIFEGDTYCEGGFKHIAIACDDVEELFNKALGKGAEPHIYPKEVTLTLEKTVNAKIAFVKGINGEQIELFEEI